jgi:hypothetical protein
LKKCTKCGIGKELSEYYSSQKFSKKKGYYTQYTAECKKCTSKRNYQYALANPEIPKKAQREIYKKESRRKVLYENQKARADNGKYREWVRNNPDKSKQYSERHRNHEITIKQWLACKDYFVNEYGDWCCAYCGFLQREHFGRRLDKTFPMDLHKEHVEHDGANDLSNCIPSCQHCNSSKRQKSLIEWYPLQSFFTQERLDKINQWLICDYNNAIK